MFNSCHSIVKFFFFFLFLFIYLNEFHFVFRCWNAKRKSKNYIDSGRRPLKWRVPEISQLNFWSKANSEISMLPAKWVMSTSCPFTLHLYRHTHTNTHRVYYIFLININIIFTYLTLSHLINIKYQLLTSFFFLIFLNVTISVVVFFCCFITPFAATYTRWCNHILVVWFSGS